MSDDHAGPESWKEIEYLAGRASEGQRRLIEAQQGADEHEAHEFGLLKQAWEGTTTFDSTFDYHDERQAWEALQQRIRHDAHAETELRESSVARAGRFVRQYRDRGGLYGAMRKPFVVAAMSLAAAAVVFTVSKVIQTPSVQSPTSATASSSLRSSYTTANGERATIELTDGTTVVLSVGSQLELVRDFGRGSRVVRLKGEAYFNVKHASSIPFIVESGQVKTTVLGTEFGVRAYGPSDVRVAVRSGKVAVNQSVLVENTIAYVNQTGTTSVIKHENVDTELAFASGKLVLSETKVQDAIPDLNRWYDVDIRLGDNTVGQQRLRGVLANGSVDDLKNILALTLGVRVERQGRILTLYPR